MPRDALAETRKPLRGACSGARALARIRRQRHWNSVIEETRLKTSGLCRVYPLQTPDLKDLHTFRVRRMLAGWIGPWRMPCTLFVQLPLCLGHGYIMGTSILSVIPSWPLSVHVPGGTRRARFHVGLPDTKIRSRISRTPRRTSSSQFALGPSVTCRPGDYLSALHSRRGTPFRAPSSPSRRW